MTEDQVVPTINADNRVYWEEASKGRLMIRQCCSCSKFHFLPRYLCPFCWSDELKWLESSGKGTVHTFTIVRRASLKAFASKVPYVVALIDLSEGPRMMGNILGSNALEVKIGDAVKAIFDDNRAGITVPQFTIADN
jgi:uncharacterized protein